MSIRVQIRQHERGLRFRRDELQGVLGPGIHWLPGGLSGLWRERVDVVSTLRNRFEHTYLDYFVGNASLRSELELVELGATERALVWRDDRLGYLLGPGRHAFWKVPHRLEVERFDSDALRFDHPRVDAVLAHPDARQWLRGVDVDAGEEALLFHNGELVERLEAGRYVFWKDVGNVSWKAIDLRERTADIAGQDIMTSDKVTLRVNFVVTYKVVDSVRALTAVSDYEQAIYRAGQLAVRAAIGSRTLDRVLVDKELIDGEVREVLESRLRELGVEVRSVGLRDVILPGDMKSILNRVIEAQKQAEANLVLRREETAAARSQANTARLLADNPVLQRMKELESLREILAGSRTTFILGGGDVAEQIRRLVHDGDE